jgi:hypothetical protein
MNTTQAALENNVRHTIADTDHDAIDFPLSVEDLNEFVNDTTRAKLAAWAASTSLGLRHKLTDMAIQAVK